MTSAVLWSYSTQHQRLSVESTPLLILASSGDPKQAQGCLQPQPHWQQLLADLSQGKLSRHSKADQESVTFEKERYPPQLLCRDHMCPDAAAESGDVSMVCQPAMQNKVTASSRTAQGSLQLSEHKQNVCRCIQLADPRSSYAMRRDHAELTTGITSSWPQGTNKHLQDAHSHIYSAGAANPTCHFNFSAFPDIRDDSFNSFPQHLAALLLQLLILWRALLHVLPDLKGFCGGQVCMQGVFPLGG